MMRASLIVLLALAGLAAAAGGALAAPEKAAGGIRFTYTDPNAGGVSWAGEFNGWNASATPMARDAKGVWSVVVPLPAGEHQYKFVVDGQWVADPENGATAGDMGNSVVRVGADGSLGAAQATANSPYSAKILIGGRIIGLFQDVHNPTTRRFEMRRPEMDTDLSFDVRVSDVLRAHLLTNINSEQQNTQDYRTNLAFDRGSLEFAKGKLQVLGWDNLAVGSWDDPLPIPGNRDYTGKPHARVRGKPFPALLRAGDAQAELQVLFIADEVVTSWGRIGHWFERYHATRLENFRISDDEMAEGIGSPVQVHPCKPSRPA